MILACNNDLIETWILPLLYEGPIYSLHRDN
jgi:hypothetical protein